MYVVQLLNSDALCAGAKAATSASMPFLEGGTGHQTYLTLGKHASLDIDNRTDRSLEIRSPTSSSTAAPSSPAGLPRCLSALSSTDLCDFDIALDRGIRREHSLPR